MSLAKTVIIKSNMNCNLRCKYCYEFNRNGEIYSKEVLTPEQLEKFIEKTAKLFPNARLLWMLHGGEPLINGIEYFNKFIAVIRKMINLYPVEFKIAIQTNATMLTDQWISVMEENIDLLSERIVSVSIDGPQDINDLVRVNSSGKGSYTQVDEAIDRLKKSQLVFTTISVVGQHNVRNPEMVYRFIRNLNPSLCKFIPCYNFDSFGNKELFGITPSEYAEFMCRIYDLWIKDISHSSGQDWFVIDPIATIVSKLSDTFVTWCEYRQEKCDNFICLYPDGELWLCDTFNHNTMRENAFLGNINTMSDDALYDAFVSPKKLCAYDKFYSEVLTECNGCDIYQYCVGGCVPYRQELREKSADLFEDYCKGKHTLISYIKGSVDRALSES